MYTIIYHIYKQNYLRMNKSYRAENDFQHNIYSKVMLHVVLALIIFFLIVLIFQILLDKIMRYLKTRKWIFA